MTETIYAIGDIHGQLANLQQLHTRIERDRAAHGTDAAIVVHVGDLVDRGPDSAGVIDLLLSGQQNGKPWIVLKGNHDRLFRDFLDDPARRDPRLRADYHWLHPNMGGFDTLASYGIDAHANRNPLDLWAEATATVPESHRQFLTSLPTLYRSPGCAFAHAGIRPGIALDQQAEDDLIWIRQEFHDDPRDHGTLIVHGHTPVDQVTHFGNRLDIDTGAGFGRPMSAVAISGTEVFTLEPDGRHPVPQP